MTSFQTYFKHMPTSKALHEHTLRILRNKLQRFRGDVLRIHVTYEVDKTVHKVSAELVAKDGFKAGAIHNDTNIYRGVEFLAQKLVRQLLRHKAKILNYRAEPLAMSSFQDNADVEDIDADEVLQYELEHDNQSAGINRE